MKTRMFAILLVILIGMFLVSACSSGSSSSTVAPPTNTQDGATLLQERCTVCHTLSRVESANNTSTEWEAIVDRMISKGAKLNADEKTLVIDYLATTYGQ